jgi:hypothetical protein
VNRPVAALARLAAVGELIRFASVAPMRWPGERESDDVAG